MEIGIFNPIIGNMPLEEACKFLNSKGIKFMEIGCGGNPGKAHCNPDILLNDEEKFKEFKEILEKYDITPSAFSAHDNPVHPNKDIAAKADKDLTNAFKIAQKMGVEVVVGFSGCPGEDEDARRPNWVTCSWPDSHFEILQWQWNEVLIPYWKKKVAEAKTYGIHKIALELHPGFCVYNVYSLLKLREAVGPEIGANLDLSHLMWQGAEPVAVIRELGKHNAIFHFHAKDTKIDPYIKAVDGVVDTRHWTEAYRPWKFRSVGCGHDLLFWKDIVAELRLSGYDYVLSIEHEDSLMSKAEGLEQALSTLRACIVREPAANIQL
ncbi:MAG: sugar phosphate isomerase/epimerase [Lachnospiraceae bacterium]